MNLRTIYQVLEETTAREGAKPALHQPTPKGDGRYVIYTWTDFRDIAREIALGLRSLGVQKGDIVAIYSETRAEFYLVDIGVMANGSVSAALYTSYPAPEQVRNLRVASPVAIVAENPRSMSALREAMRDQPLEAWWILMTGAADGAITLDDLRERGRRLAAEQPGIFDRIQTEYTANDFAILYLTSGATGEPKMGLVTHAAIVANIDMAPEVLPVSSRDRTIVFLPSAHIAQRIVLEMVPVRMGTPVWFSESLAKLPNEFRNIQPTFFLAPPRVWERVYASICTEIRKRPGPVQKLFYAAIGMGAAAARLKSEGRPIPLWMKGPLKFFDHAVYSKIRKRLGGRMRIAASGAAPLSKELGEFYAAIGMPLIEGYGLTEGGVVALNPLDRPRPGSIGKLLPGVEARIAEDGELLIKSPCLFSGYFKDPEATAAVLKDGWLYTGDIAEVDSEGYWYITGRKKELIVSSNGKKIYPGRIETLFKSEPLINHVVLIGDKMPYVTALVTIDAKAAERLPGMESEQGKSPEELAAAPPVLEEVRKAVSRVNKKLASFEQIRKFKVLERDFTIESGEMTPTMKVRRSKVLENHREVVSQLYLGKDIDQT
jgi:long-chain acyl-CoA synthetase